MLTVASPRIKAFLVTAFFLSGGCALVYEVLWTRYLAELMGATSLSHLVVLTVLMGGLAVGAAFFGRMVDRGTDGLLCYGWLEIFIGLYAICFPVLFVLVDDIYLSLARIAGPGTVSLQLIKLVFAVILISLPAVAMGGTLPAVTRYLTKSRILLRRNVSILYGINSLGAVIGVLAGGFYFVHTYGVDHSMIFVGLFNLLLGAVLLLASWYSRNRVEFFEPKPEYSRREEDKPEAVIYETRVINRAVIAAGVAGLGAMALQVAWIRYFAIVLGATHSAFTLVVAAFIFGIGIGALLARSRFVAYLPLPSVLAIVFGITATFIGFGLFFYGRMPFEIGRGLSVFARTPLAWPAYEVFRFGLCFSLMLLPTVASGMILPICVRIAGRGEERIGRDVGKVYAVNTLGSLVGIILAGQVLFRISPLPLTMQIIMFIYVTASAYLAFVLEEKGRKRTLALVVALVVIHVTAWRPWLPQQLFIDRVDFQKHPLLKYEEFLDKRKETTRVSMLSGPDAEVVVMDVFPLGKHSFRTMYINGKPDASNDPRGPDLVTEVLLVQLPILLHPDPAKVFILGAGSGISSGEALKHSAIKEVVTVELAGEVFESSKLFAEDNGRYWENPKHRLVIEDGQNFLRLSKEKFDVIALEPTNVWQEGMAGLFSEDFFRMARARLEEDGVLAQWLHTYRADDVTVNIILKTFSRVFPRSSIFYTRGGDLLLMGYNEKWQFDPLKMEHRFYRPGILESMKVTGNPSPASLLLREVISRDDFRYYTDSLTVPINTANFPVLELAAEYSHFLRQTTTILQNINSRFSLSPGREGLLFEAYVNRLGMDAAQYEGLLDSEVMDKSERLKNSLLFKLMTSRPAWMNNNLLAQLSDPLLREVISDPNYRRDPGEIPLGDSHRMIGGEMLVWTRASSRLWSPSPERLHALFERTKMARDPVGQGVLALQIAIPLSQMSACSTAIPFLRLAAEQGVVTPDNLDAEDVTAIFHCEVQSGDLQMAKRWWEVIEHSYFAKVDKVVMADKVLMDIKMGGKPPPPYYGRLPSRWEKMQ